MSENSDEKYMRMCLDLAQKAHGATYPNPMVGCVIVHNNTIIGSGYHKKAGQAHAEVAAIESVTHRELLSTSTLYVTLEPCAHYGKTPPCCDAIIAQGIPRVVVGCTDSFHKVSGKGIERMRAAGIQVDVGVLEKESRAINSRFFTYHEKKRPYIILKWAQTQDGFIDQAADLKKQTKGLWITDDICKKLVHEWRAQEQSILVGTIAAETDNPELTVRLVQGPNPLRLLIDLQNRLPDTLHLKDGSTPTIVYTLQDVESRNNLIYKTIHSAETLWDEICEDLYARGIQSIMIEGGALVLQDIISKNLWDEMRVFTGPGYFIRGVQAPVLSFSAHYSEQRGNSQLDIYFNT